MQFLSPSKSHRWPLLCVAVLALVSVLAYIEYTYAYFNNYLIFTRPLGIMMLGGDIYDFQPHVYMDTFKYSPTFAMLVGVLSYLPDNVGIILWNVLNAAMLCLGIHAFFKTEKQRIWSLVFLLPMLTISVHNHQSNPLMAGFMLLFIAFMRSERLWAAACVLTACLFIKFYGILLIISVLFFLKKKEILIRLLACIVIVGLLPLVLVKPDYLVVLYAQWWHVLQTTTLSIQCSWMGIAETWFGLNWPQWIWTSSGLILLLLPLTNASMYSNAKFQNTMLASIFIFMILFNKMAGFPTYIVAATGCCIWYFNLEKKNIFTKSIVLSIFVLGICSQYYRPYSLVDQWIISSNIWAFPFLVLWTYLQVNLWHMEFKLKNTINE